jgi:hypothetical protein
MPECPYFQTYESGKMDASPACGFDITKAVLWGGELVCKTVDPVGTSLCAKVDAGGMQVSPAALVASVAGWWLLWSLFKGGR